MTQAQAYSRIEAFYRENYSRLTKRFNRYHNHMARAEDIVQEGMLRALRFWERLPEKDEELAPWFNTLLNNASKDNVKEETHHGAIDKEAEEVAEKETTIPKIIIKEVVELIEEQSPSVCIILKLAFLEGYTANEIAQIVPQKNGNIRQIIHQFRKEVRDKYMWAI